MTLPITISITEQGAAQPLAKLVHAVLDAEQAAQVLAHQGVWLNQRRVLDTNQSAPVRSEVTIYPALGGCYSQIVIGANDILYEDKWLLALNKHAGWYTTPTPWDIAGNIRHALIQFFKERDGIETTLHLAHQLDRDTSGILLCTKIPTINTIMQERFTSGGIEKTYLCVCAGEPSEETFEIRSGHGRKLGGWTVYPLERIGEILPNGKPIRLAHTSFTCVQRFGDATLMRARLHTGRTHQIRLHLAFCGYPLLGDARYGGPTTFRGQPLPFHLLHAARLWMSHPVTGEPLELEAPVPEHMAKIIV